MSGNVYAFFLPLRTSLILYEVIDPQLAWSAVFCFSFSFLHRVQHSRLSDWRIRCRMIRKRQAAGSSEAHDKCCCSATRFYERPQLVARININTIGWCHAYRLGEVWVLTWGALSTSFKSLSEIAWNIPGIISTVTVTTVLIMPVVLAEYVRSTTVLYYSISTITINIITNTFGEYQY